MPPLPFMTVMDGLQVEGVGKKWALASGIWVPASRASVSGSKMAENDQGVQVEAGCFGFDSLGDVSCLDKGLCNKFCEVLDRIGEQTLDIVDGMQVGKDGLKPSGEVHIQDLQHPSKGMPVVLEKLVLVADAGTAEIAEGLHQPEAAVDADTAEIAEGLIEQAKAAALREGGIFAEDGWHPSVLGATAKCSCSKAGKEALSATGTSSGCSGVMAEAESIASSICKSTVREVDQSTILEKVPLFVDRLLAASREGRPCTFSDVGAEWFIELEDLGFDLDPERVWDFYKAVLAEAVRAEKLAEGGENSRVRPRRRGRP